MARGSAFWGSVGYEVNWYQACPGRIRRWVVYRLANAGNCVGELRLQIAFNIFHISRRAECMTHSDWLTPSFTFIARVIVVLTCGLRLLAIEKKNHRVEKRKVVCSDTRRLPLNHQVLIEQSFHVTSVSVMLSYDNASLWRLDYAVALTLLRRSRIAIVDIALNYFQSF